ncbi:MAG: LytTR family DNA-binding domain-containing protein [Bacteroidia bacterium]|jgi:DNA-binding LytR/AlgR family response regulator|nr:LytTR family DNA-binding domain-containing protein [Bacteroidia bacterium]
MNIFILEDEAPALRRITKLVQEILPQAVITGTSDSVSTASALLKNSPEPHLILADIQLADGLSFDLFEQIALNCPVIFTTAFDEYAIRAFKLNSIDYLLKPIDREALSHALDKYHKHYSSGNAGIPAVLWQEFIAQMRPGKTSYKNRFLVSKGAQLLPIAADEIAWFVTEDRLVFLHTHQNQRYICDHTLDELESLLNPEQFYRANRQFVIAVKAVKGAENGFNGKLHLHLHPQPEEQVVVSREKAAHFKDWLAGND